MAEPIGRRDFLKRASVAVGAGLGLATPGLVSSEIAKAETLQPEKVFLRPEDIEGVRENVFFEDKRFRGYYPVVGGRVVDSRTNEPFKGNSEGSKGPFLGSASQIREITTPTGTVVEFGLPLSVLADFPPFSNMKVEVFSQKMYPERADGWEGIEPRENQEVELKLSSRDIQEMSMQSGARNTFFMYLNQGGLPLDVATRSSNVLNFPDIANGDNRFGYKFFFSRSTPRFVRTPEQDVNPNDGKQEILVRLKDVEEPVTNQSFTMMKSLPMPETRVK